MTPMIGPECADGWNVRAVVIRQCHEGQRGADACHEVKQQELGRTVHLFEALPEPVKEQHVEQDVPDIVAAVAVCARHEPPDLPLRDGLFRAELEPILDNRGAHPWHAGQHFFHGLAGLAGVFLAGLAVLCLDGDLLAGGRLGVRCGLFIIGPELIRVGKPLAAGRVRMT